MEPRAAPAKRVDDASARCYLCLEDSRVAPLYGNVCACRCMHLHRACQLRLVNRGFLQCSVCKVDYTNASETRVRHLPEILKVACFFASVSLCLLGVSWMLMYALRVRMLVYFPPVAFVEVVAFGLFWRRVILPPGTGFVTKRELDFE